MSGKTLSQKEKIIALGYFDGVHTGHVKVLSLANKVAKENGFDLAALSFKGNLRAFFKKGERVIYTFSERNYLLKKQGVKKIIQVPVNREFLSFTGKEFLDFLFGAYGIKNYVCGKDYVFGSDRKGVNFLECYARSHGGRVFVADEQELKGEKISATAIKEFLSSGDIESANAYLGQPYFITGRVFADRHIGTKLGYPTVNVKINKEKSPLLLGVYGGHIFLDNKRYDTVINYGTRPTFNLDEKLIEAHIIGYSGNLYGKRVRIFFDFFIRGIMSFSCEEQLKERIKKDIDYLKEKNK